MINIEEYRGQQTRQPTRWSSLLSMAAATVGAFVISAFAVLNRDKIPGPNQWISFLSAPAEADTKLSFSGDRVGRSEIAPLLKICVTKDLALDADSNREIDPAKLFQSLVSARRADPLTAATDAPRGYGAVELAAKRGLVADCVYRLNSWGLCDVDNRAFEVQAANTFLGQADQIASKPETFSANQTEIESLKQVKSRVLDSMQYLVRNPIPRKMPAPGNSGIASRANTSSFPAAGLAPYSG